MVLQDNGRLEADPCRHEARAGRVFLVCIAVVAVLGALALGCGGDDGPDQRATTDATDATELDQPSAEEETDVEDGPTPRPRTPLNLPRGQIGDEDAARLTIEAAEELLYPDQRSVDVPWPNLQTADPVAAYNEASRFQTWMLENNPTPELALVYTAPDSPEREDDLALFRSQNPLLRTPPSPEYSLRIERLVHPSDSGLPEFLVDRMPEGSAAIVYYDTLGASRVYDPDSGDTLYFDDGWTDLGPWVAVMAPSEAGWQVWYDALIDPIDLPELEPLDSPQV